MASSKAYARVAIAVGACVVLLLATWFVAATVRSDAREAELNGLTDAALATVVGARTTVDSHVQSMLTLAEGFVGRKNRTLPMEVSTFQSIAARFSKFGGDEPRVSSMSVSVPVLPSERAAFEAEMGAKIRGFPPPREAPEPSDLGYFTVVTMLYPLRLYGRGLYGVDIHHANADRAAAIDRCLKEDKVVATGIIYPPNNLQRPGATFHAPIRYDDSDGRWGVLAMFVERELFAGTFQGHGLPAFVRLEDRTDPAAVEELYVEPAPDASTTIELATLEFEVATRMWHVTMLTTEDVLQARITVHDLPVWIIGACFAVLLGCATFVALQARHRAQMARLAAMAGSAAEAAHLRLLKFLNHELRNPLAVVIACVDQMLSSPSWPMGEDLMASASDAAVARQDMRIVLDAAQRMALVLEDAAEVKRVGDVGTKPSAEHTDIVGVLRDTANQLSPFMVDGAYFVIRTHPGVPRTVMVDGRLLRHIVTAAVQNGLKHATADRIELRARSLTARGGAVGGEHGAPEEDTAYVVVEVLTEGPGLLGKVEADLMSMELVTATVPAEVRRAAAQPTLEPAPAPADAAALALAEVGVTTSRDSSMLSPTSSGMLSNVTSSVSEATAGVAMLVAGTSVGGSSVTAHPAGYTGAAGSMNLAMCYRLAVAMGGAAGIADVPREAVWRSQRGPSSPSHRGNKVTRFWVVVQAPPATEPAEIDLLAAVIARDRQAEMKARLARNMDVDSPRPGGSDEDDDGVAGAGAGAGAGASTSNTTGDVAAKAPVDGPNREEVCVNIGPGGSGSEPASGAASPSLPNQVARSRVQLPPVEVSATRVVTSASAGTEVEATAGAGVGTAARAAPVVQTSAPTVRQQGPAAQSRLRRHENRRAKQAAKRQAANLVTAPDVPGGVIVVDDERMFRRAVTRYLKALGVAVAASLEDGDELQPALGVLETPPSAVLLDIVMRRSVGVDVLRALRQNPRWASLPVYAMTSNVERVEEYRTAGFTGLLGKPFSKAKLAAALHHAVNEEVRDANPFLDATHLTSATLRKGK